MVFPEATVSRRRYRERAEESYMAVAIRSESNRVSGHYARRLH